MENEIKTKFSELWEKYFTGAELPIVFYYTDDKQDGEYISSPKGHCFIGNLQMVRKGKSLVFGNESIGCFGGKRYAGYCPEISPDFEYFLSYGIPGKMEGERYLKTPDLVKKRISKINPFSAPKKYIAFKRWDNIGKNDNPEAVIFFASPDIISGLYTLANFDEEDQWGIFTPFGAGCSTVIQYPYQENQSERPRCIIGMFDVSARPYVNPNELSFSIPMKKFVKMIDNMNESFLITNSWKKVQERIARK